MPFSRKILFLIGGLFLCLQGHGETPVTVMIVDGPVDYQHPSISHGVDTATLKKLKHVDEDGKESTWFDFNNETLAGMRRRLENNRYDWQQELVDRINKGNLGQKVIAYGRFLFSPKFRRPSVISASTHGTAVTSVAINPDENIRFVNYPMMYRGGEFKPQSYYETIDFKEDVYRTRRRAYYDELSKGIVESGARIVNMSYGWSLASSLKSNLEDLNHHAFSQRRERIREVVERRLKVELEEWAAWVGRHPEVIFVHSAGNSKLDIDGEKINGSKVTAKNLIRVAAWDREKGALAKFSNHSPNYVSIAADGVQSWVALAGEGLARKNGTSFSAPRVTRALANLLVANPDLRPEQAFLQLPTAQEPALLPHVASGSLLLEQGECAAEAFARLGAPH